MKTVPLHRGPHWEVSVLVEDDVDIDPDDEFKASEFSETKEFLNDLEKNEPALFRSLSNLIDRVANAAPNSPPSNTLSKRYCHEASKQHSIWELTTGRTPARIYWFHDEGRVIICTHGFLKRQGKTPKKELNHAIDMRSKYYKSKQTKEGTKS